MPRKVHIRTKIFFIVLVAVLPTVLFSVYTTLSFRSAYLEGSATYLTNLCNSFTNEQRLIARNAEQMLLAISKTRSVMNKEYSFLNRYLSDLMFLYQDYAVLLCANSDGMVIASSINKTGYSLSDRPYFNHAKATNAFTIGQYIVSRSTGVSSITYTLPVRDTSGSRVFLIGTYALDKYSRELSLGRLGKDAVLEIADSDGVCLFSSSSDPLIVPGQPLTSSLFSLMKDHARKNPKKVEIEGKEWFASTDYYSRNGTALYISVRIPYENVVREALAPVSRQLSITIIAFVLALTLSLAFARRLFVYRIERLTEYTDALARGNLSVRSGVNNAQDEITELMESFNTMAASLEERNALNERTIREKEQLLLELQKRVSDNLQILSSIINLQIGYASNDEVRQSLMTTHSRVMALSLVYETLYLYSDVQQVEMHRYSQGLCDYLVSLYTDVGTEIQCEIEGEEVALPIDKALPVALIINELVSNSIVHAFPYRKNGFIGISFAKEDGRIRMEVRDDGSGFEEQEQRGETLGYEMIGALVEQVHGSIVVNADENGSCVSVIF